MNELTFGDLFAGCGGFSLGACAASARRPHGQDWSLTPSWAIDINSNACATYTRNLPIAAMCADARDIDFSTLPPIDVLLFGFPCADFSEVGAQRGVRGPQGLLYQEGVRALRALRPKAFVAENVRRLRAADGGAAFRQIVWDLELSGYRVSAHLYKAEEYGLAQTRHRVFLVGLRRDLARKPFRPPAPTTADPRTVREVLDRPVPVDAANAERRHLTPRMAELLAHVRHGESLGMAVQRADFPAELKAQEADRRSFRGYYRRLHPDRPAGTLIAGDGGGGKTIHHDETRPLINRERARLQGFPDDFSFVGAVGSVCDQIGMSVPPPMAETVLSALLARLAGRDYASVDNNIPAPPPRKRGRPARLESRTVAQRSGTRWARATREYKAAARACATALAASLDHDLPSDTRAWIACFVGRHVPEANIHVPAPPAFGKPTQDRTREQRYRNRLRAEAASARTLLGEVREEDLLAVDPSRAADLELCRSFLARGRTGNAAVSTEDEGRGDTRAA